MSRTYPDEPTGPFPELPRTITDEEGRRIAIEVADESDEEGLFAMYRAFDPADRAQGIPPTRGPAIDRWLDTVLHEDCVNVIARHVETEDDRGGETDDGKTGEGDEVAGDEGEGNEGESDEEWAGDVVGHATLVPDDQGAYELAIFVLAEYQGAGIGTAVLESLLGHASAAGIERVWLTVERWNHAAIALYRSVGFETTGSEHFEMEMAIRL